MVLKSEIVLQNETENSYYKVVTKCNRGLLQSAPGITKCDRLLLQSDTINNKKLNPMQKGRKPKEENWIFLLLLLQNHILNYQKILD